MKKGRRMRAYYPQLSIGEDDAAICEVSLFDVPKMHVVEMLRRSPTDPLAFGS
jgi:hypothetical protein